MRSKVRFGVIKRGDHAMNFLESLTGRNTLTANVTYVKPANFVCPGLHAVIISTNLFSGTPKAFNSESISQRKTRTRRHEDRLQSRKFVVDTIRFVNLNSLSHARFDQLMRLGTLTREILLIQ